MAASTGKTAAGNTYWPNSYQKHHLFVDTLMRLLTPSENVVLDVAIRCIGSWDKGRETFRSRIAQSIFVEKTGLSRNTVRLCLGELERANILLPTTERPHRDGQEHELNLGQRGDYDWAYLQARPRHHPNGQGAPGLNAMQASRRQQALPDMGVAGGQTQAGPGIDPYQTLDVTDPAFERLDVQPLDTLKRNESYSDKQIQATWSLLLDQFFFGNDPRKPDWRRAPLAAAEVSAGESGALVVRLAPDVLRQMPALAGVVPTLQRIATAQGVTLILEGFLDAHRV